MSKAILAIDPGTSCGWALRLPDGSVFSGTWALRPNRYEGGGMRWLRLRRCLEDLTRGVELELVAYEEVRRHKGTDAAHVYGGIVATLQAWCETQGTPYTAIPVAAVKKRATGKGNAGKELVTEAARAEWPTQQIDDDNQADALWIMRVAEEQYT